MAQPRYYTTQQIAKMLGVSIPTVVNWVKQGRIEAHKTPGGHRRISAEALAQFSSTYAYPLLGESQMEVASGAQRALVVDKERDFGEMVGEYLQLKGGFEVRTATSALEAGFFLGSFKPHVVLLDLELDDVFGGDIVRLSRTHHAMREVKFLGTTTFLQSLPAERLRGMGLDGVIEKPLKLDEVLSRIKGVVG